MNANELRLDALLMVPRLSEADLKFVGQPEFIAFIARKLGETAAQPVAELAAIVERFGTLTSFGFLKRTMEIEAEGGLVTLGKDQRRRTMGGVFFRLAALKRNELNRLERERRAEARRAEEDAQRRSLSRDQFGKRFPENSRVEVVVLRKRPGSSCNAR